MDNLNRWKIFESTGKVEDYLKYADERRLNEAREMFISAVEGDKTNGRNNHGNGDGYFLDGDK